MATVELSPRDGFVDVTPDVMDEQLTQGYFLQANPKGGCWRLYDIREPGECRICEIHADGDNLEIQVFSGPYEGALEHWNTGVQEQLICTNRIIELLWQQEAPQAVSDQLAAWHREDEAREFASLQGSTTAAAFSANDHERDFREWVDALYERLYSLQELSSEEQAEGWLGNFDDQEEVELSPEERLRGGLDEFYAQEAEMERQLGAEARAA